MARNTSVALGDYFEAFIASLLNTGHYATASEVIRDALRLLEAREAQIAALRASLQDGIDSGPATDSSMETLLADLDAERE